MYSYDALVYFGEDIEKSVTRVAKLGYDAIELAGEDANSLVPTPNRRLTI
jgi:hypothetical protein